MKADTPSPPGDEAPDPLLATLRQRLGDYGAAPPPAAWAAIRQRVAPPARPWWRRPRRLLPLLTLLLGVLLVGTLSERRSPWASTAKLPAAETSLPGKAAVTKRIKSQQLTRDERVATNHSAAISSRPAATAATARQRAAAAAKPSAAATSAPVTAHSAHGQQLAQSYAPASGRALAPHSQQLSTKQAVRQRAAGTGRQQRAAYKVNGQRLAGNRSRRVAPRPTKHRPAQAAATEQPVATLSNRLTVRKKTNSFFALSRQAPLANPALLPSSQAEPATALALLAPKQLSLLLPSSALPAMLAARPDSTPLLPPVRHWALLLVAGPTLSYRTLGAAPTLAAGHPDFARLERPALGLGAQVQVRRVLSGRWALAAGLGYHEYATWLALTRKDSAFSVHQRDFYRLLTLPVQITYALGAPRGRLAKGLLLGTEPGLYLGGRSTEGSGCGCEQQVYTSAAASPYRAWSLAFSLGLDLRYQLGGPASRWRWVVQPTARYVATPFVRGDAGGFTPRQPFSLGLLTGFSWEVR